MDNFRNSMNTLKIIPGNSIGRSCRTIRTETIIALMRIMICFGFIVYLLTEITLGFIASHCLSAPLHLSDTGSLARRHRFRYSPRGSSPTDVHLNMVPTSSRGSSPSVLLRVFSAPYSGPSRRFVSIISIAIENLVLLLALYRQLRVCQRSSERYGIDISSPWSASALISAIRRLSYLFFRTAARLQGADVVLRPCSFCQAE